MARIELRHCVVRLKDGLGGTAKIDGSPTPPAADATSMKVKDLALNNAATKIPVGARFTVAGETTATTVHTVTARTPADEGPTTEIEFTPKLGAGTYADDGVITLLPQQLEIKMGDGNLTYSEKKNYDYLLDRGNLDTVREGNEAPMEVKLEAVYEHITTGTGEDISPMDALKGKGAAAEWVSSSPDKCEPYCVDLEVIHTPPCGTEDPETTLFPEFRADSKDVDFQKATISVSGKCKATEPIVTREAA